MVISEENIRFFSANDNKNKTLHSNKEKMTEKDRGFSLCSEASNGILWVLNKGAIYGMALVFANKVFMFGLRNAGKFLINGA